MNLFSDPIGASEMLWRDYFNWISSVSHSWFAMVPKSFMVLFIDVQLLFLWWKFGRLLRCGHQSCGIPEFPSHLPSILIVHIVLHWFRLVCVVTSQEILHETIQFVRLDTCRTVDCCDTKLFNYSEYIRR